VSHRFLVESGADVGALDSDGRTALAYARGPGPLTDFLIAQVRRLNGLLRFSCVGRW
jgi:hypothetical protein